MSKKINAADIVAILATELSLTKKVSDDFISAFVITIEEALLQQDSVRINDLGTFKTQWNKARKSVDVNTGEDILIDGYYKVTFTPESSLKELANQPYEHLESILLDDDQDEGDGKKSEQSVDTIFTPLQHFDEQATEIKDLLSEINALNDIEEEKEDVKEEKYVAESIDERERIKEEVIPDSVDRENIKVDKKGLYDDKLVQEESKDRLVEDDERIIVDEPLKEEKKLVSKEFNKSQKKIWRYVYVFIVVIAIILLLGLLFDSGFVTNLKDYIGEKSTLKKTELSIPANNQEVHVLEDGGTYVDQSQQDVELLDAKRGNIEIGGKETLSNEILTTEIVKPGSRLAQIAYRHYGAREFWVYIYDANRDKLKRPDDLSVGMELRIPKLEPSIGDINNPECIEKAKQLQDVYLKK